MSRPDKSWAKLPAPRRQESRRRTPDAPQTAVDLTFTADKDRIFNAWNAIANLAEMAGELTVTVHAEEPEGFDKSRLENCVIEPLREADLIESEITVCILAWIISFHAIAEVVPGTHNPIESDTLPENSCHDRPRPNTMPDDSCWRYRRHKGQPRIL